LDFIEPQERAALRRIVREFAESELKPHVRRLDEGVEFPHDLFKKIGAVGYLGITVPEKYDGAEMSFLDYAVIIEEIARVDPAIALGVAAHNGLCCGHILRLGSEELKQE